ncbi:hypothetical protein QE152_g27211 [Popillia japonica]|uniref:Uncharacterized protein n=1 Tax=Popillia japonica TaxID=7064 RepID=A0AAW1JWW6_POPJA
MRLDWIPLIGSRKVNRRDAGGRLMGEYIPNTSWAERVIVSIMIKQAWLLGGVLHNILSGNNCAANPQHKVVVWVGNSSQELSPVQNFPGGGRLDFIYKGISNKNGISGVVSRIMQDHASGWSPGSVLYNHLSKGNRAASPITNLVIEVDNLSEDPNLVIEVDNLSEDLSPERSSKELHRFDSDLFSKKLATIGAPQGAVLHKILNGQNWFLNLHNRIKVEVGSPCEECNLEDKPQFLGFFSECAAISLIMARDAESRR